MAKKKLDVEVKKEKVVKNEFVIFKPSKPLTIEEFNMVSEMVKSEEKKIGVKIILMPYSCEVVEDDK